MHKWHKVRHGQSRRTFTFIGCTFIFLQEFHFFHISIHMHFSCMRSLSQATISIQFLTEIINKIIHSQMSVLIFFEIKLKSICYYTYIHFIQKKTQWDLLGNSQSAWIVDNQVTLRSSSIPPPTIKQKGHIYFSSVLSLFAVYL